MSLLGVYLTTGQPDQSSNTLGHKMSLPRGGSGWLFVRWPARRSCTWGSMIHASNWNIGKACQLQANLPCEKSQPVRLQVGQIVGGGRTGGLTTLGPSPWCQHSHWFPMGQWWTWPRSGKWHKWVLQPFIYLWHYFQGLFAVVYLHDLITYSCTKCRERLYWLFSLQTNLLISFHHQSDVSLHQDTTFKELLL